MRYTMVMCVVLFGLFSATAMAGGGHDHGHSRAAAPVDQATAEEKAAEVVAGLVGREELEASWSSVAAGVAEKQMTEGRSRWQVVFVNEAATDAEKQKLYVLLTLGGDYIGVSFDGK